jgi:WhiB family redox-sensing transcriptional regulator
MTTITEAPAITWICARPGCGTELDRPSGHAHGFCRPCAMRWYRAGMPEEGPPPQPEPSPAGAARATQRLAERRRRHAEAVEAALSRPIDWPVPAPPVPGATSWQDRAACRGHLDLFYAPEWEPLTERAVRELKAQSLCGACPVRRECGEHAAGTRQKHGVWAGRTEDDREQEKRDQRNAKRRVASRRQEDGAAA